MKWLVGLAAVAGLLVVAFFALRTPDIPADVLRQRYGGAPSQFVDLAPGLTVHLQDTGPKDAPALFLIHGSNASLHTWEPWVDRLTPGLRVVTLDLQGHGLTGAHPQRCYTRRCMAATVEAVRRHLGVERLAIGGNSMGGSVSIAYALAYPERVAALILVDSSGAEVAPDRPPPVGFRIAGTPLVRTLAEHVTPRVMIARSLEQSVSVPSAASEAKIDRYWELLRHPGNRTATLDRFAGPREPMTAAGLGPLRDVPVLILWGAEDRLFPPTHARWFQSALPHAELIIFPGTGHLPQEEKPESADAVATFLGEVAF